MKRLGRMWMVAVVMGVVGGSAQGKYGGGTGEPNDPYQIWDANDMQAIGADPCDWDKCFILMADIDLGQFDGKDGREEFNTIGRSWYDDYGRVLEGFSGVFDGNGRTVYNLTVYGYGDLETGLFGVLNGGTIRDLGLVDPNVSGLGEVPWAGPIEVGSLVGLLADGVIDKCYVEGGRVSGCADVGGLVGCNGYCFFAYGECFWVYAGTISDCYVVDTAIEQPVTSWECECSDRIGGLVGDNWGTLTKCYSAATVTGCGNEVGGLVGRNTTVVGWQNGCTDGLIAYCYSNSSVDGNDYVGGLLGVNWGSIMDCYATGSVNGNTDVGGLVGIDRDYGTITNCYATGVVLGSANVGGLVGENCYLASVSDCSSASDVSGDHYVGGLVGFNNAGSLSKSYSTGYVSGRDSVGGLAGGNVGTISNCYFAGCVSASSAVGGLVGENGIWGPPDGFVGAISRSYSTGNVQGVVYVGGLVGDNNYGDVESSFWDIQTSSEPNMCGYQDFGSTGCDPNYGLPTSQLHQQSTFTDWDFINVWNIGENQTYPYLRTVAAGDINKDRIVNFLDLCIVAEEWMKEN